MRTRLLAQVRDRVNRFNAERDATLVLAPRAVADAVDLICSVPDPVDDVEVAQAAGWLFWLRFAARGSAEGESDLTVALELLNPVYRQVPAGVPPLIGELFDGEPQSAPDGGGLLARLGRMLYRDTLASQDAGVLDRAVALFRLAAAATGPEHAEYGRCRTNLSSALLTRFERTGAPPDLEESITFGRAAVEGAGPGEPDGALYLSNLGNALLTRFEYLGGEPDLDAAIAAGRAAVTGWPDHPDRAALASNLDLALRTREALLHRVTGADELIDLARDAVITTSPDHPAHAGQLSQLGHALLARFERAGDPADLDEAVEAHREAVAVAAPQDAEGAASLSDLGDVLRIRFVQTGDELDLADAVEAGRAAVAATRADDPDLCGRQSNLANALCELHRRTGGRKELDEAVALARRAVAATPADGSERPSYLSNLCDILRMRFERTGQEADIDEAVEAGRAGVAAAPPGHPHLPAYLGNLGAASLSRFRGTGGQADLDEAVDALRMAVAAAPDASPHRGTMLANLGGALQVRFDSVRRREDLDEAVDTCREAVLATPADHSSRGVRLSNLGAALQARFSISGERADIDEAAEIARAAAAAVPDGHPRRAGVLSNRAIVLHRRYEHTGEAADVDAAIGAARAAVAAIAPDHPDRAGYLANLGGALGARSTLTGAGPDLDEAIAACREGAATEAAPPRVRAVAAARWARLAAEAGRWEEAAAGYAAVVDLMGRTVPRGLDRRDQEILLGDMGGIGSDAAACCVRAGQVESGVELFEQGRGLLLGQALDTRTDLTALSERHPDLAGRFTALCTELDRPAPAAGVPGSGAVPAPQGSVERRATAAAFDRLVAEIRELPGFDRFLRPPTVPDLVPARGHIVIVNVSDFGSHALVLHADTGATAVPLPALTPDAVVAEVGAFLAAVEEIGAKEVRSWAAGQHRMSRTLEWLWDAVAGPVLDHVGIGGPPQDGAPWPRLWWCLSGLMSFLPVHAAGYHGTMADAAPETVVDRVVCSTAPTVRALAHARRGPADAVRPGDDRAVAVAMPRTPGTRSDLPGAEAEAALIGRRFPGPVDVLTGSSATHGAVLSALPKARWAHFACHGHSDLADPSSSHLLLVDHQTRPLTVTDLAGLRLDGAELAFLSACSTARPGARLADEAIHLASAFQLAGYRHVIGTLWPIGDRHAVDIADLVYTAVADGGDVAGAVHAATRQMRDRWPDYPSVWASHVHVGA
ncbi:CHAT domain-containing protein [Actinomadura citrea]|uniref:CHAT domain-containing protein n=1 Tax=Actinomadura citrea TaxID=46158 RepID=UPI002E29E323|nr:CHAT domain-containing protein [Actinomadura citrea]